MADQFVDRTGGQGSFFDQVANYGYHNGTLYRDKNEYLKAGGTGNFDTGSGQSMGGGGVPGGVSFDQPTIDLPGLYKNLYDKSGVSDLEKSLSDKTTAYNAATAKINDNPFYSEATRVGRVAKLDQIYNADKALVQTDLATKKADIETQMNIQTKQFDINSTAAKTAFDQFNSLLTSGALDNASPADIANITRATGVSSSMIQSAIQANKAKNVQTQTIQWDDGTNTGFAVVNSRTGDIISKQVVAASAPTATEQKAAAGGGASGGSTKSTITKSSAISIAKIGVKNVDTNRDKLLSYAEFQKVVQDLLNHGATSNDAVQWAAEAMSALGYGKWRW